MNQVYFYPNDRMGGIQGMGSARLNPFMNQVYFYVEKRGGPTASRLFCLNPFMNQVYFYAGRRSGKIPRIFSS